MADDVYVIDPLYRTDADFQKRLINFDTGRHALQAPHKDWLDELLEKTPATREFHCHIYGYASKRGNPDLNKRLSHNRASAVARYLEERNPKYTSRIETFQSFGEEDPGYNPVDKEFDNDPRWRAVEVHVKFDKPPTIKPGVIKLPGKSGPTHMKWSVCGYFSLTGNVELVAQFGIALYKFRNDENGQVRTYVSPTFGLGGGINALQFMKFLKDIGDKKLPAFAHIAHAVDKVLANPALLANPYAALKEIGMALVTGVGVQDWTDYSRCEVYMPLSHRLLDGKSIGNVAATGINYQIQRVHVYGKVWHTQKNDKKMYGTRDLCSADSTGWIAQVPALAAGAVGGPLIMI